MQENFVSDCSLKMCYTNENQYKLHQEDKGNGVDQVSRMQKTNIG